MSITTSEMTPADIRACTCGNDGYGNGGMWGGDWFGYLLLFALFGGAGFGGFGGFGGGGLLPWLLFGNNGFGGRGDCATQADLAAGFNNSAVLSSLNDLKLGQSQGFNGINTAILQTANGIDNAICTLGYQGAQHASNLSAQLAQCCCDVKGAIKDNTTQGVMNTNALSSQLASCCCDIEKMNMQSRFDAQAYNCNTLQAIDKLGDRIIDYMSNEKTQALRDENQALRLAASQANQNNVIRAAIDASTAEIIRRTGNECPIPAYVVPNPNCCYGNPYGVGYNNGGCGCGNGGF